MAFHQTQKILFRHCDPAGIVFYPRYFEMINDVIEAFFDVEIGTPFETMLATHGVPTVQIAARFEAPSRHGDLLDLRVRTIRVGGASLNLCVDASCEGETRFSADISLVRVRKDMTTERWTDAMRAAFTSHLEPNLKDVANG